MLLFFPSPKTGEIIKNYKASLCPGLLDNMTLTDMCMGIELESCEISSAYVISKSVSASRLRVTKIVIERFGRNIEIYNSLFVNCRYLTA